jgi:hypothetical protein
VIVAITAVLVPTGIAIANSYHYAVTNCSVNHVGCGDIASTVFGNVAVLWISCRLRRWQSARPRHQLGCTARGG